ncbi:MAG TPA: type II secretion system F family protein [Planctomycetota bacterium]|nr:type II secretion system F family protein [Planctomycetota bacterium]
MPTFVYKAVDAKGSENAGTLVADSRTAAMDQVAKLGFTPVFVKEGKASEVPAVKSAVGGKVGQARVEAFTRGLANLLAAGVPLSRGLNIAIREASNPLAKATWTAIHDDVVGGMSLADAMARHPRTFPPVYVAMVRAGEMGGFLDLVLGQIAEFQQREQDLKGKVKAALIYPIVLAGVATAVMIFMLTFFIPRFSILFKNMGGSLPWLTQVIVGISNTLMTKGPYVLGGIIVVYLLLRNMLKSENGRRTMEKITLSMPLLGVAVARFALVRFCRMLGTLIGSGVPLISALKVSKEAIGNQILSDTVGRAIEEVQKGASLSKSLGVSKKLFPPSVVEMVAVAEETARLDKELMRMSGAFEVELDRQLRMLVALAEPALLFIMASLIGTVVVGMLLPIFNLQELVH